MTSLYDTIGLNYADLRRPDPRIARRIEAALGDVSAELGKLANDLESGEWERRYGHLASLDERDCGYRLVVAV